MISAKKASKQFKEEEGRFMFWDYLSRISWLNETIQLNNDLGRRFVDCTMKGISSSTAEAVKKKLLKKGYSIEKYSYSTLVNELTLKFSW